VTESGGGPLGSGGDADRFHLSDIEWVDADHNPWGVPVIDIRPLTQTVISTTTDQQCAANAVSYRGDDGAGFIGEEPEVLRDVPTQLSYPVDRRLADGVLFAPEVMEHTWALFCHGGQILFVRGWKRRVAAIAQYEQRGDRVAVVSVRGTFTSEDEAPELTCRVLDYLLRRHALRGEYPAPLAPGLETDSGRAAMWCFSMFGNRASFATPHPVPMQDPDVPLRTFSLLHIAVARRDAARVEAQVSAGVPVDLLAPDGRASLHWAITVPDGTMMALLLWLGSPVDARSEQGATPLMSAVQNGSLQKTELPVDHGADVDACDDRGFTSLHRAAELGHVELVRLLLGRGVVSSPEAQGRTPRRLGEMRGHADIVALLDQHGAV
jgi:hypothetical protein